MNTPNPLVPQGSLGEQAARGKSNLFITFFVIAAAHVLVLCGVLISGCTRQDPEEKTITNSETNDVQFPALTGDTNSLPTDVVTTNTASATDTNVPVAGLPVAGSATDTNVAAPAGIATPNPGTPTVSDPATPPGGLTTTSVTSGSTGSDYQIQKGDSFYTIHKKTGVPLSAIVKANPGVNPNKLKIGQHIVIPAYTPSTPSAETAASSGGGRTYTVKSGDSLSRIATKNGTTVKALREANNLRTDRINVNQKLIIPGASAPSAPAANPGALPGNPGQ